MRYWALALLLAASLYGQETIDRASLGGTVTDASGGAIGGAPVSARHIDTNLTSAAVTDREGRFRFSYLRIGSYEITVRQSGFQETQRRLTVTAGGAYDLAFTLGVDAMQTSVEVSGEATVLEGARSQIASTVTQQEVRALPVSGRSFLDLALLAPGVSATNTGSNQLFAETSAVPGQGISVGSQRNFSNNFVVDGLSANDDAAGLSGVFYGLDTIQEVQVVTSGGQAELGRALGGFISVVTKSGTNQLHGDLYGYFRNQRLNAANPLSGSKLPLTQAQYGASAGGPVQRDRSFFFGNFEQRRLQQSGLTTISPDSVLSINRRLDEVGYAGSRVSTGVYGNPVQQTNGLAKLDQQLSAWDLLTLRYSVYGVQSDHSRGAGGLNAATAAADLDNADHTVAISNIATLLPRTINETRGQVTMSRLTADPSDPSGPAVTIAGVATFGRLSSSPTGRDNTLYEIVNNLSHQAGKHAWRAGVDFVYNDNTIRFPRSVRGSYSFASLAAFLNGTYNNSGFTQTFGNSVVSQGNPNVGIYVQDEWKVARTLTLNLGLRYDLQFLETIATDRNNIAPRAGFAWSPSSRTVVRGSYGLFYDRVPLRALANALLSSGNSTMLSDASQVTVSLSPAQIGAPVFPSVLGSRPAGVLVNFTTMDRRIPNAYSTQGSFEIEQQLGSRTTVSAGYEHLRGIHLIASINQNAPQCVAAGSNNGCRPNAVFANNSQYRGAGDSYYDGLQLSLVQRPARWGSFRVSYTYSKSLNNVGEFFFSGPLDAFNIWRDYARSDDDQRHRVVFSGVVQSSAKASRNGWDRLSHGWQMSGTLQYYSALPLNITTGANTIQGTVGRPLVNGEPIGRNTGVGSDLFNVSVRASRRFAVGERVKLEALAEAFNALNHRNNLTKNGVLGTGVSPLPTFGVVTAVNDPRAVQLGLRVGF